MKRFFAVFIFLLITVHCTLTTVSHAFFIGFGSAGAVDQVIRKGQAEGKIPKTIPGDNNGNSVNGAVLVWQKIYNSANNDLDAGRGVAVDSSGNIYVAGYSNNGINLDCLLIKYDINGDIIWQKVFDGGNQDVFYDIAIDHADNIYVTGYSSRGTDEDYLTIKYDSDGNTIWQKISDSSGNEGGYSIAVDDTSNVYVTGASNGNYLTTKHDPNGNILWSKWYNSGGYDEGHGIAVDSCGCVYVTGSSQNGPMWDYLTIKYDSNGNNVWQKAHTGSSAPYGGGAIAVDSCDNVYVTGTSNYNCLTIKYNPNGNIVWQKEYDNGNYNYGKDITIDSSRDVYVAGYFHNNISGSDYYLIMKYNYNGDIIWQETYNIGTDGACYGMAIDDTGNVYITGRFHNGINYYDCLTIKYRQY
ncbi:MAG: SBBP repeat-containing protein [Bacteroidota bacterium]